MTNDAEKLLQRTLPTTTRLWSQRVLLVAGVMGGGLLVFLFLTLSGRQRVRETPKPPANPSVYEVSGTSEPDMMLKLQRDYAGWNREPAPVPKPPAPPVPLPASELPPQQPMFPTVASLPTILPALPPPQAPLSTTLPPVTPPVPPVGHPAERIQAPGQEKPKPNKWLFAEVKQGKPPFEASKSETKAAKPDTNGTAGTGLLKPAEWVEPTDPTHAVFPSQVIHGLLQTDINSDISGPVLIKITRPLQDKFQSGVVLIPQHAYIIGHTDGAAQYGDARIKVTLDQIEMPSGVLLKLTKAGVADQAGASGLQASVNNHWGSVITGAILSAVLSVGARNTGGNGGGSFQSSPELEVSRSVSQNINQSGQEVIRRELVRKPTLTVKAGEPVTLSLSEALSLSRPPVPVR